MASKFIRHVRRKIDAELSRGTRVRRPGNLYCILYEFLSCCAPLRLIRLIVAVLRKSQVPVSVIHLQCF